MKTLTKRLRESAAPLSDPDLNDEAADELDRFRTSLVRLKMQLDQQREYHAAELADVISERDHAVEQAAKNADEVLRLREALEKIAAPQRPDGTWNRERLACWQLAVEALKAVP